jgi:hypothetical protein
MSCHQQYFLPITGGTISSLKVSGPYKFFLEKIIIIINFNFFFYKIDLPIFFFFFFEPYKKKFLAPSLLTAQAIRSEVLIGVKIKKLKQRISFIS